MATEYRYLRLDIYGFYENGFNQLSLAEFEAMEAGAPSTDICTGGTPSAFLPGYSGTYTIDKAFDNSTSTFYASILLTNSIIFHRPWVEYDLGSGVTAQPNKYVLTSRGDFLQYPTAWKFMLSNDRVKWVVADTRSGETFTQGQTKTYTFTWYTVTGIVTLSGVVQTNRPVVVLKNSDFSYLGEGITNGSGVYSIDVPYGGDVVVTCKGASGQRPAAHTVTTTA